MRRHATLAAWVLGTVFVSGNAASAAEAVRLSALDLSHMRQDYGKAQRDRSIRETPLAVGGKNFAFGVGTHAASRLWVDLSGGCDRFQAWVGVDDAAGGGATLSFTIIADGKTLFDSDVMKWRDAAKRVDIDLRGVKTLLLKVGSGGDGIAYDHADWGEAVFVVSGVKPSAVAAPREPAIILTPDPRPAPRINGPKVYGCRPGNPFVYRIPTTGTRPIAFAAEGLPEGIALDAAAGILAGKAPPRGRYVVTLRATNSKGEARRQFTIVSGDTLALTPTMGYNHWYAHYDRVTDASMRQAADAMVASGMADVGYSYVSIDDCWMNAPKNRDPKRVGPLRDDKGNIVPNKHFPDMKALTDHIHAKGLKAGIYTSPGPFTCAGFCGTYQHEEQDARQFAEWGFDLLKYDWCSYSDVVKGKSDLPTLKAPYIQMGGILKRQPRDIVLNLCQYGMGNVWEWGEEVGGQSWRTAGDLGFELDRVFEVALKNAEHRKFNHPGSWNDPDYIQIGNIGAATEMGKPIPCPLTPSEQYAFMSLWCLMASPLFYSGDMNSLDPFTINVLCNPEVIEVNQDPLGQCAKVVAKSDATFVMVKDMEDGTKAVGLFNRGEFPAHVEVAWRDADVAGPRTVRNLWRQEDVGKYSDRFDAQVPRRGCVLIRLLPPQ